MAAHKFKETQSVMFATKHSNHFLADKFHQ